jgi:2-methylaconitate cis-trans-isomerase PrpF
MSDPFQGQTFQQAAPPAAAQPSLLSVYVTAAGTALQVAGQVSSSIAARNVAKANAAIVRANATVEQQAAYTEADQLDFNATLAREDATLAEQAAAFRVRQARLLASRRASQNLAVIGASGVTVEGSPLEVLLDQAYQDETEARLLHYQGQLEVLARTREADVAGYQAQVRRTTGQRSLLVGERQAGLLQQQGDLAALAGYLRIGGTITGGAGRLLGAKYPREGLVDSYA